MEPELPSVVAAFCDSSSLRETLSVLLEHECRLRFLNPESAPPVDSATDVAIVATRHPSSLLRHLSVRWASVPIVVVGTQFNRSPAPADIVPQQADVHTVPLEPHAIRQAVLERLTARPHGALRATVRSIAETLRAELAYPFTALRTLTAAPASGSDGVTDAVLGTIVREQTYVLDANVEHLQRLRDRPRAVELSSHFVSALCRQLEQSNQEMVERGLLCECATESSAADDVGPLTLVPMITSFLRAHLRRRSASPVVRVRVTQRGIQLRYEPRRVGPAGFRSWPLLLASLALQPWSWRVDAMTSAHQEMVGLRPA
jgi:hypothetical protein